MTSAQNDDQLRLVLRELRDAGMINLKAIRVTNPKTGKYYHVNYVQEFTSETKGTPQLLHESVRAELIRFLIKENLVSPHDDGAEKADISDAFNKSGRLSSYNLPEDGEVPMARDDDERRLLVCFRQMNAKYKGRFTEMAEDFVAISQTTAELNQPTKPNITLVPHHNDDSKKTS